MKKLSKIEKTVHNSKHTYTIGGRDIKIKAKKFQ